MARRFSRKLGRTLKKRTIAEREEDLTWFASLAAEGASLNDIVREIKKKRTYTLGRTQVHDDLEEVKKRWRETQIDSYERRRAESEVALKLQYSRTLAAYKKSCTRKLPEGNPQFLAVILRIQIELNRINDLHPRSESEITQQTNLLTNVGSIAIPAFSEEKPAPQIPTGYKPIIDIT